MAFNPGSLSLDVSMLDMLYLPGVPVRRRMIDGSLSDAQAMFQALAGSSHPYTTTREAEERFHLHAPRMRHNKS